MGIRTKILTCLLAVLIPVVTASMFTIGVVDTRLSERVESELTNARQLEAARIVQVLERYREDANAAAASDTVRALLAEPQTDGAPRRLTPALQRRAGISGGRVVELRIIDPSGHVLGESSGFTWTPLDETLPMRVMSNAATMFGNAFPGPGDQRRLGVIAPILDEEGAVLGALLLETRLGPVIDLVTAHEGLAGLSREAHVAQRLPNGDAQFITPLRFDRDAAFDRIAPAASGDPIVRALSARGGEVLRAPDYRGVESVLAIRSIPDTGWGLVLKIDESEARAPLTEIIRVIQLAALATALAIFFAWSYCMHSLARRLNRLATGAQRVANGQLSSRIDDHSIDEIGEVARSINRLAVELDADRAMRGTVEDRLRHQALHDELTGLHNRKRANAVIAELSLSNTRTSAIAFLDLDGFKGVNDLYGHAAGDAVLIAIAGRLRRAVDDEATLARWGGDEFVVILPDGDEQAIEAVGARIRRLFNEPIVTEFGTHQLGCSIGLATSGPTRTLHDAITDADARMYEQKTHHRLERSVETVAARNVEKALRDDRIEVWYQPIVAMRTLDEMRLQSAEALVRMRTPEGEFIGPDDFLPEIRKRELGRELDRRVMTRSLEALARWRLAGVVDQAFRLSINLTGESLRSENFVDDVAEQLARLEVPADRLIVELSEQTGEIDATVLSRLRALGVGLALDDLGLQRSNLDRLVGLSPDIAKIDRQWVDNDVVLPRLIDICRQLGMQIVAEGVETKAQLARLHALGVISFQGFLLDRPEPGVQFLEQWGRSAISGREEARGRAKKLDPVC